MSALIRAFKRTETAVIPRLPVIMLLLFIIASAGFVLLFRAAPQAVEYPQRYLTATPSVLCPGETFTYPVVISVDETDAVSHITEGWCRPDGVCPRAFQNDPYYVNFLDDLEVSTTATRTVPVDLPPVAMRFVAMPKLPVAGRIDVTCYAVDITVKDCEVQP